MVHETNPEILMDDSDLIDLVDDNGRHLKFFHVGSTEYLNKWYAFFMPAEEIEGLDEEEVVIFEVAKDEKGDEILLPVQDGALLECVYEKFCQEMDEEADAAEAEELEGGCCCGHHHEDGEECGCGHHHGEGEECECGHHHEDGEECGCGHHHGDGHCKHGEGKKSGCKKHKH